MIYIHDNSQHNKNTEHVPNNFDIENNRLSHNNQSIGKVKNILSKYTAYIWNALVGLPITAAYLISNITITSMMQLKRALITDKIDENKIRYLRQKITWFQNWVQQTKEFYSHSWEKILALATQWYDLLEHDFPDILNEYMQHFWLKNKQEYMCFVKDNMEKWIEELDKRWYLQERSNMKSIPRKDKFTFRLLHSLIGWYAQFGQEGYFVSRVRKNEHDLTVQSTTVHEAEHFMQNAIIGNITDKKIHEKNINWMFSPVYYSIFKKMEWVFRSYTIEIKKEDNNKTIDGDTNVWKQVIAWVKEISDIFKYIVKQNDYYGNILEIMARIREIKIFLGITAGQKFTKNHLIKIDGIQFKAWKNIKDNIISNHAFIEFMNKVP